MDMTRMEQKEDCEYYEPVNVVEAKKAGILSRGEVGRFPGWDVPSLASVSCVKLCVTTTWRL
jgi:hypothetical protein